MAVSGEKEEADAEAWADKACSVGVIRARKYDGCTPIHTMNTAKGASAKTSRAVRSLTQPCTE